MNTTKTVMRSARWLGAVCLLSTLMAPSGARRVEASDHIDAPQTQGDAAADIGDFYAWHTDRGTIVAVLTFNMGIAPIDPGSPPTPYDPHVLYTIHIDNTAVASEQADFLDNDNDNTSDIDIHVRFGLNGAGDWGVQFSNIPDAEPTLVGPVQTIITSGSAQAIAGVFDDPFFFDFDAYIATAMNLLDDTDPSDVAFTPGMASDTFAGSNVLAIVVEFDAQSAADGNADDLIQMWATTGRLR